MHGIAPYKFFVVDDQGISQDLWNINNKTFKDYLEKDYFKNIINIPKITQVSSPGVIGKNYIFKNQYQGSNNSCAGFFETGEFGFAASLFNTVTKSSTHQRSVDESMMIPFHFCFYMPKTGNIKDQLVGILNISRFNGLGIKSIVIPDLILHFEQSFPGLFLKVEKIVPTSLVQSMITKTNIKKIKLTISQLPRSIRQALNNSGFNNYYEVEMIIKPKPGDFFSTPTWWTKMGSNVPINSIISIPATQISKIKVEVGSNQGRTRTINVHDVASMASNIEINNPKILQTNHIDPQCWLDESDALSSDIYLESGLNLPKWNTIV